MFAASFFVMVRLRSVSVRRGPVLRRQCASLWNRVRLPLLLGFSAALAFPTSTGFSDIAALLSGAEAGPGGRWRTHLTATPAGALQAAQFAFADPILTGSTENAASLTLPDGGRVSLSGKIGMADPRPDEARVTRDLKTDRVLDVVPVAPPKHFTAGSVVEESSLIRHPDAEVSPPMAFVRSDIAGEELAIAQVFHARRKRAPVEDGVPAMLAGLVTNRNADILATAYAPPPPDYARQSPFASLLAEEPARGRFIPPLLPGDHAWVATPLPASVFSAKEQRCLAAGIYFEARGESLKGQAAVAQVILNRVRNPAYPATVCGVVYQNDNWRNRCQFSFACDGRRDRVRSPRHWQTATDVAMAVTAGKIWLEDVGSSTHYHATYVRPRWARTMRRVGRIGLHVFYRTYGGGWS